MVARVSRALRGGSRRKSVGGVPPPTVSGRVTVVPRRSIDSAARRAPPPPSPTPVRKKRPVSNGGGGRGGNSKGPARRKAVIINADMAEELQRDAVECATRAIEGFDAEKDIAACIKKEFDRDHGTKWHCVVGRHFGSFVTHETNHFIYLSLGKVAVLLFKAGDGSATTARDPRAAPVSGAERTVEHRTA